MRYLLGIVMVLASLVIGSSEASVTKIVGSTVNCDSTVSGCNPIPLTGTNVCIIGCVLLTAPDFNDPTTFIGNSGTTCKKSTDSGATWGNCPTSNPLASGARESLAIANDGSWIIIGDVGARCTIKRSIDKGTIWTTVLDNASRACGGTNVGDFKLKCLSGSAKCTYLGDDAITGNQTYIESIDNGQNWTVTGGVASSSGIQVMGWDGTTGIGIPNAFNGASQKAYVETSGTWSASAVWGAVSSCWGAFIAGTNAYGMCYSFGETYKTYTTAGVFVKNFVLPGTVQLPNAGAIIAVWNATTYYVAASKAVGAGASPIGIWVTKDSGTTFNLAYTGSIQANSMREGSAYKANGCVWFSAGTGAQLIKVC